MFLRRSHPSPDELLLSADGSRRLGRRVREHIAGCRECQARLRDLEQALRDASRAWSASQTDVPSASVARARLRSRLAEASARAETVEGRAFRSLRRPAGRWASAGALLACSLLLVTWLAQPDSRPSPDPQVPTRVFLLPDADLTPGATRPVRVDEVCGNDRDLRVQPIPLSVHQSVFRTYGADFRLVGEYELDHLITPELGGTQETANLWPQPFGATAWNAYVKDELERLLHQRVCDGQMDFTTAQQEMAEDWIAAYKRHFDTETPLRNYLTSPLTISDTELIRDELGELGIRTDMSAGDGPLLLGMLRVARLQALE